MAPQIHLDDWRKKQAAMLYHFSSDSYLIGLRDRVDELNEYAVSILDAADRQKCDGPVAHSTRRTRNRSMSRAASGWSFVADFRHVISRAKARREAECFERTGFNDFERGLGEHSILWAALDGIHGLQQQVEAIGRYASYIDLTTRRHDATAGWDDFLFATTWNEHRQLFPCLPRFRVRSDIEGVSSQVPPRTGVYVAQDDPYASLQFAWTGGGNGRLLDSSTFNAVGLDALKTVGQPELWVDNERMLSFGLASQYKTLFKKRMTWLGKPSLELAASAVAMESFEARPCKWYFVEMLEGDAEQSDGHTGSGLTQIGDEPARPGDGTTGVRHVERGPNVAPSVRPPDKRSVSAAAGLGALIVAVPVAIIMLVLHASMNGYTSAGRADDANAAVSLLMVPIDVLAAICGAVAGALLLRTRLPFFHSCLLVHLCVGLVAFLPVAFIWKFVSGL